MYRGSSWTIADGCSYRVGRSTTTDSGRDLRALWPVTKWITWVFGTLSARACCDHRGPFLDNNEGQIMCGNLVKECWLGGASESIDHWRRRERTTAVMLKSWDKVGSSQATLGAALNRRRRPGIKAVRFSRFRGMHWVISVDTSTITSRTRSKSAPDGHLVGLPNPG